MLPGPIVSAVLPSRRPTETRGGFARKRATRPTASSCVIELLVDHVDGDPQCGGGGPLGAAGLEHVELAALDGELEVLDVAVVLLELVGDAP